MLTFHIYNAADGWRWRLKGRNGKIIADSGEAYASRKGARRAVRLVRDGAEWAWVVVVP